MTELAFEALKSSSNYLTIFPSNVACLASVSVEQRAKNGVFGVLPARKNGATASFIAL